jgi:hypothetical protein
MAREKLEIPVPLVIRLIGTNEEEGRELLSSHGIEAYDDLAEAVQGVVARAREGGPAAGSTGQPSGTAGGDPSGAAGSEAGGAA